MSNDRGIKQKHKNISIKSINKTVNSISNSNRKIQNISKSNKDSIYESADSDLSIGTNYIKDKTVSSSKKTVSKSNKETKKNLVKVKQKTSNYRLKNNKVVNKSVDTKTIVNFKNNAIKQKNIMKVNLIKNKLYNNSKKLMIGSIKTLKYALLGTKALISMIISGGSFLFMIIIVFCFVGMLCSSFMGIFFSGSNSNTTYSLSSVIQEINSEFTQEITSIQNNNTHDEYILDIEKAQWSEVIAIYCAKVTNGNGEDEVITLDERKKQILKNVFWDMHDIAHRLQRESVEEEQIDDDGNSELVTVYKRNLYINSTYKTVEEMIDFYNFNDQQVVEVEELLSDEYKDLWSVAIYGVYNFDTAIVEIAKTQLGNIGGEPYWSWYGYEYRVEWCATFVSWIANEIGYIESGIIPKFSSVRNGVEWFKMNGQWNDSSFIPKTGTIIFFDWNQDGIPNHVGIVEKVEDGMIYTIEGNSNNMVKRVRYNINSSSIFGYGTPDY